MGRHVVSLTTLQPSHGATLGQRARIWVATYPLSDQPSQDTYTALGAWIGIMRKKADSKFYWVDGTSVEGQYTAWYRWEPDNFGGNENCGHMYMLFTGREVRIEKTVPEVLRTARGRRRRWIEENWFENCLFVNSPSTCAISHDERAAGKP